MPSFGKLALLVAIVAFVWFGWRWFQGWEKERRLAAERRAREEAVRDGAPGTRIEELARCSVCTAYVPATTRACARSDCPFPR